MRDEYKNGGKASNHCIALHFHVNDREMYTYPTAYFTFNLITITKRHVQLSLGPNRTRGQLWNCQFQKFIKIRNCVWNRPETKPLPHSIRLLFFKICISLACFRGSRGPLWTLFGAVQILALTKSAIAPGFWSQWQFFIFLTPDCPQVRLDP